MSPSGGGAVEQSRAEICFLEEHDLLERSVKKSKVDSGEKDVVEMDVIATTQHGGEDMIVKENSPVGSETVVPETAVNISVPSVSFRDSLIGERIQGRARMVLTEMT